jgi:uncharacterized membrane protein YhaH (DUF805 family)
MSQASEVNSAVARPSDVVDTATSFDIIPSLSGLYSINGRTNRTGYFLVQFFQTVTFALVGLTAEHVLLHGIEDIVTISTPLVHRHGHGALVHLLEGLGGGDPIRIGILIVLGLAWFVIGFTASVRRLHDLNASGWWLPGVALIGLIPYVGGLANLIFSGVLLFSPGTEGRNDYGEPPEPIRFWSRLSAVPQHIWRGETPLLNMLLIYVFFMNFLVLDKAFSEMAADLDLSTGGLLFVGALLLLNATMAVGLWRSATLSQMQPGWRLFGKAVAILLGTRVAYTLLLLTMNS